MGRYYVPLLLLLLNCTNSSKEETIKSDNVSGVTVPNKNASEEFIDLDAALIMHSDSVRKLYLGGSGLKSIPKVVFTFRNLKSLDIGRNRIDTIPSDISKLKYLEEFDVAYCGIKYFSSEIVKLKNLKYVNLLHNQLFILPTDFCKLESLFRLNLTGNNLSSLPECICDLTQLRFIRAGYAEGENHLDSSEYFRVKYCLPDCSIEIRKME
ncbi:MAG: leucine-rich repeat domain-containing protein [Bacteroidota bacterium]